MEPLPKDLEDAALRLEPDGRARLALRLIQSLDAATRERLDEEEIERLWIREAQERLRQIDAGEVELIPADELMERLRAARSTSPHACAAVAEAVTPPPC